MLEARPNPPHDRTLNIQSWVVDAAPDEPLAKSVTVICEQELIDNRWSLAKLEVVSADGRERQVLVDATRPTAQAGTS